MERTVDNKMSRLCGRLMSVAQNARDQIDYILEEMEYIADSNTDREDVRACIDEIKSKNKTGESENWAAANHWSEHFDSIDTTDAEGKKEPEKETDADTDGEE